MRIARVAQRDGIDLIDVPRDKRGKSFLRAVLDVLLQQNAVVQFQHLQMNAAEQRKVTKSFLLEIPNSDVTELHESGKASRAAVRPLKADRTRFFPRCLSRVGWVVGHVADFCPVQCHLEALALERYLDMVPFFLLAEIWELLVARIKPENVSSDGPGVHTVDDDADELSGLATPEVHLITGPQIHAAIVRAVATRTVRGGRLFGEYEVQLQLDILEFCLRNETPTFLTRSCLSANDDAVLHFPTGVGGIQGAAARGDSPAGEVLAIEERLPRFGRLQRRNEHGAKQREDDNRDASLFFYTPVYG